MMARGFRVGKVEPEFYFHFELRRRLSKNDLTKLKAALRKVASSAFREAYPEVELQFEIDLETGSIRGWIRVGTKTVVGILVGTTAFFSQYGSIKSGAQAFWEDATRLLETVKESVEQHIGGEYGIRDHIRTECRKGAIARLDELINARQKKQIIHVAYMAEATAILSRISESEDRKELVSAVVRYIDTRYPKFFPWQSLGQFVGADLFPGTGRPPRPRVPLRRPRPDAAILKRRKRRKGKKG